MIKNGWTLCDAENTIIPVGSAITDFRGELHTLQGGTPPHKPESTGSITTDKGNFYPAVCDLKWIKLEEAKT